MHNQPIAGLQIVTGKGGVGKSTIAAAIACSLAAKGHRVLAIDALGSGGLNKVFEASTGDTSPVEVLTLTTVDALTEYVHLKLRVPASLLRPLARLVDFVAMAAPGVREILIMGKICHEARTGDWDHVVVDGPSTGHIVELLNAPQSIAAVAPSGPLGAETEWMAEMLARHSSSVVLVALPEQLSSSETVALAERITQETKMSIGGIVLNRVALALSDSSLECLEGLAEGPVRATAVLAAQRHEVGIAQQQALAETGLAMAAVSDAITPLAVATEALTDIEWCTGSDQ